MAYVVFVSASVFSGNARATFVRNQINTIDRRTIYYNMGQCPAAANNCVGIFFYNLHLYV
jgi:hypothetical protein